MAIFRVHGGGVSTRGLWPGNPAPVVRPGQSRRPGFSAQHAPTAFPDTTHSVSMMAQAMRNPRLAGIAMPLASRGKGKGKK